VFRIWKPMFSFLRARCHVHWNSIMVENL
jgi:hypothetical protein